MNFLKNNFLTSIIFSELAIQKTGSDNLETITEWLISHDDDPVEQEKVSMDENAELSDVSASVENPSSVSDAPVSPAAKSIQCDECGKLFKTQEEVEFHATKSGNLASKYLILLIQISSILIWIMKPEKPLFLVISKILLSILWYSDLSCFHILRDYTGSFKFLLGDGL